jgi:hypothetical protein
MPLRKVRFDDRVNIRLKNAIDEIIRTYGLMMSRSWLYDALCISGNTAEMILYINTKNEIKKCVNECVERRKEKYGECLKKYGKEECGQYDENLEKDMCEIGCEEYYAEEVDDVVYSIMDGLKLFYKYGINYKEMVKHFSQYEMLIRARIKLM